jgi:hypothetical protein
LAISVSLSVAWGADVTNRLRSVPPEIGQQSSYYWKSVPVGTTAELLTLFCGDCAVAAATGKDTPLVAILRDTLGDPGTENDRLIYVWLLTYSRPNLGQRLLSAVPFFYWRVGKGSAHVGQGDTKPLLDLTAPQHPVLTGISRELLQYTLLDPMTTPIRATSRAYRTNEMDHERLHLEEAIHYLRQAPASPGQTSLSATQLDTVIARLELRKKLLGGFVSEHDATKFGQQENFEQEQTRTRNWELLRQSAERTGLVFEPLDLAGTSGQYAMVWFPAHAPAQQPAGAELGAAWKLLGIRNPWKDQRFGEERPEIRVPLGLYSLNYPRQPLLLIDFRDKLHLRWHEMTQRSINEITSGVIGISHFTNWYYYVAADLYDFVASRHGRAMNQAERLDCYSQFRVALALDQQLDPALRAAMQQRVDSLAINPLETAAKHEVQAADARYALLTAQTGEKLTKRLNKERRTELARFQDSRKKELFADVLHDATLGIYTRRAKLGDGLLSQLNAYRRIQHDLNFLDKLAAAGTPPEVAYQPARIKTSMDELTSMMGQLPWNDTRAHAERTLIKVRALSEDPVLQADCTSAIASLRPARGEFGIAAGARAESGPAVDAQLAPEDF